MTSGELLSVEPPEIKFPFELKKQISCALQLSNKTDSYVAFKVKTTNPKKYCVRPNTGVVLPRTTCDVIVTMQAQREAPLDMQCKDKFLLQSVIAKNGATVKDITAEMFNKEAGNLVDECKLRVLYASPPQPPSPVPEEPEEASSPRASLLEHGNLKVSFDAVSKDYSETKPRPLDVQRVHAELIDNSSKDLISRLNEEKNSTIQQNNKLQHELELLRREASKGHGGFTFLYVILTGFLGIIIGYLARRM